LSTPFNVLFLPRIEYGANSSRNPESKIFFPQMTQRNTKKNLTAENAKEAQRTQKKDTN